MNLLGGAWSALRSSDEAIMAGKTVTQPADATDEAWALVPDSFRDLADPQRDLPRIARDQALMGQIESAVRAVSTRHDLHLGDARRMDFLTPESIHLVVTSPPYWTLKEYRDAPGQLGHVEDYNAFLAEIDQVWRQCYEAPGCHWQLVCPCVLCGGSAVAALRPGARQWSDVIDPPVGGDVAGRRCGPGTVRLASCHCF